MISLLLDNQRSSIADMIPSSVGMDPERLLSLMINVSGRER